MLNSYTNLMRRGAMIATLLLSLIGFGAVLGAANAQEMNGGVTQRPAVRMPGAIGAEILGVALAGARVVAVGDHGTVLLSDDDGKSFRQAVAVPTRASLNAVHFIDERQGWAVGHWGVILATDDGGENWARQRDDLQNDRPLFSVWFKDAKTGLASGLWGLILRTTDGGKNWSEIPLPPGKDGKRSSDKNLFSIFPVKRSELMIAGERGAIFLSRDDGLSWNEIPTGNKGTFWTGITLKSGAVLVAGVRGHVFRSENGDDHWQEIAVPTKSSVTAMTQLPGGRILAVGMDGLTMTSDDDGRSFVVSVRSDRLPLTAVMADQRGSPLVFSVIGPVRPE